MSSRTTFKLELGHSLVVWWLGFYASAAGSVVQSLLGELRSCIPPSAATKKKERERKKRKCASNTPLIKQQLEARYSPLWASVFLSVQWAGFEEWGQVRGRRLLHPKFLKDLPNLLPTISLLILLPQPKQAFVVIMGPINTQRI